MQKTAFCVLAGSICLAAQTATDVPGSQIDAIVKKTASAAVSDTQVRVVSINDEYNIGVGVVHRARVAGKQTANGIEHSEITEIYHVISGTATLVTGGTMEESERCRAHQPGGEGSERSQQNRRRDPERNQPQSDAWRCHRDSSEHTALVQRDQYG